MNRALLQQALDALESLNAMSYEVGKKLMDDIEAELAKPKPEPVAYMLTTRNFGLGGETWDTTEYRDYPWDSDCVPLYAAPTEPNCKFPTCHSQEYQNKLVQEILGQEPEPYAWVFVPHNELLWPDEVEHKTPCEITGYVPLYTK